MDEVCLFVCVFVRVCDLAASMQSVYEEFKMARSFQHPLSITLWRVSDTFFHICMCFTSCHFSADSSAAQARSQIVRPGSRDPMVSFCLCVFNLVLQCALTGNKREIQERLDETLTMAHLLLPPTFSFVYPCRLSKVTSMRSSKGGT